MRARERRRDDRLPWLPMAVAALASAALTATLFGVQAAAVRGGSPAAVAAGSGASTGTLDLRLRGSGAGFEQAVSGLVPGDVVHRYVTLRNAGTLPGRALSLAVAARPAGPLTVDGPRTRAARASVALCSGGTWRSDTGACDGLVAGVLPPVPLSALSEPHRLGVSQLRPGQALSLRVTVQLPDQDEQVVNGQLPPQSVQGRRAFLTWTFRQQQG